MQQTVVRVNEIAFTLYPVEDMQRARNFYESIFNLTPTEVSDDNNWVEYDIQGGTFALIDMEGYDPLKGGGTIAFEVDDLQQTMAMLAAQNVKILMKDLESPSCWMNAICDSEGNDLIIHQRKRK